MASIADGIDHFVPPQLQTPFKQEVVSVTIFRACFSSVSYFRRPCFLSVAALVSRQDVEVTQS